MDIHMQTMNLDTDPKPFTKWIRQLGVRYKTKTPRRQHRKSPGDLGYGDAFLDKRTKTIHERKNY